MIRRSVGFVKQFEKNLWILSTGWFVSALGFAISIPFIAIYFYATLGLSMSEIGVFFGAMALVRSVFQAIGGEVSDRIERHILLIYSQIFRAGAFLTLAISIYKDWGFWPVAIALLVNSIFGAIFQPVANAMVSDILPVDKRLDGYAITRSAGNLGWAVGPAIGGFLAGYSYGLLFLISSGITLLSGLVFLIFLKPPRTVIVQDRFKFSDLLAIKDDPYLARHSILIFALYLVVAQLIAPFSVYAVEMVKITEHQLGILYTLNGLMVVLLQIPVTRLLAGYRLTTQLAMGAFVYAVGYGMVGVLAGFEFFVLAMIVVTMGEIFMSPPSLTLTSRLAPEGRMGRYMGIFGFFVAAGWSFGPLYGGVILDHFGGNAPVAWALISSLAILSGVGYMLFRRILPERFNIKENAT
ncbi:MAG: MFS transporter [Candidatus Zixiibacteriota bacterium]|nr:MAG: MFS transporter [candidate division Zixibacteria bacterium]